MSVTELPKFKVGDLVLLKSGGPAMTIYRANAHKGADVEFWYDVVWFVHGYVQRDQFCEPELKSFDLSFCHEDSPEKTAAVVADIEAGRMEVG